MAFAVICGREVERDCARWHKIRTQTRDPLHTFVSVLNQTATIVMIYSMTNK
jgi:hypothetical protein